MAIIPLSTKLKAVSLGTRLLTPGAAEAFDRFVAHLQETQAGSGAPLIGQTMPEFLLPDIDGRMVTLTELIAKGPLVLSFLRGHWCPFCTVVASALGELPVSGAGGHVVVICPEARQYAKQLTSAGGGYPVLSDVDAGYALSLGLAVWINDEVREAMTKLGVNLTLFNRSEGWVLPIPATFVLDRAGRIVFRDVNPDWRVRADPDAVLAAIRAVA